MKLTAKQEKFARLVAEGNEQSTAYREVYNASKMKPETIWARASELASNSMVAVRIDKYKKEFTKNLDIASQITVERQLKFCQKAIQECLKSGDFTNYFKGLDMQNKLRGLYPPIKTDNTHKGELIVNTDLIEATNNLTKAIKSKK